MRRTAVVAALGLALLGVPASAGRGVTAVVGAASDAGTADGTSWTSECRLAAVAHEQATGGRETYTGTLVGVAVAHHPATTTPAFIDVQCVLLVDGEVVDEADDSGSTGVDSVSKQTTFFAADTQDVEICVAVGLFGGPVCAGTQRTRVPPQEVEDLVGQVLDIVRDNTGVDHVACPVLASLAPGVPAVVDVDVDGDVAVGGGRVYDCPPYGS